MATSFTVYNDHTANNLSVNTLNTSSLVISGALSAPIINNHIWRTGYTSVLQPQLVSYISTVPDHPAWVAAGLPGTNSAIYPYLIAPPNSVLLRMRFNGEDNFNAAANPFILAGAGLDAPTCGANSLVAAQTGTPAAQGTQPLVGAHAVTTAEIQAGAMLNGVASDIAATYTALTNNDNPMVVDIANAVTAGRVRFTFEFLSLN